MVQNISLDINNYIDNDPVLLFVFFSLSLFASIIKVVFSNNDSRKNIGVGRTVLKILLTSSTSSLVIFSSFDVLRRFIEGNLMYLAAFFFGFICDLLIKRLVEIKNLNGLLKFLDELYTFIKSRKK